MADKTMLNVLRIRAVDEDIWRTINSAKVLIDGDDGTIKGGAGGKMNGMKYKPSWGKSAKTGKKVLKPFKAKFSHFKGTKKELFEKLKKAAEPPKPTRESISKKAADIRDFKHKFADAKTMEELKDLRKKYDDMVEDVKKDLKDFDTSKVTGSDFESRKLLYGDYAGWMQKSGEKYYREAEKKVRQNESKEALTKQWDEIKKVAYSIRRAKTDKFKMKQQEKLKDLYDKYLRAEIAAPFGGTPIVKKSGIIDLLRKDFSTPSVTASPTEALKSVTSAFSGLSTGGEHDKIAMERAKAAASTTLRDHKAHAEKYADKVRKKAGFSAAEEAAFKSKLKKIIDDSDFCMRVKSRTFPKILDSWFMNQLEAKRSGGAYSPGMRKSISDQLFGHSGKGSSGSIKDEEYEKYGFMAPKDMQDEPMADWYGDVVVRFNKDRLKGRTTYTLGDSLDYRSCGWAAGSTDDPSLAGIIGSDARRVFKRLQSAKTIHDVVASRSGDEYMEVQYHGKLDVDDIGSVTFTSVPPAPEIVKRLKDKGIKVYKYDRSMRKVVEV